MRPRSRKTFQEASKRLQREFDGLHLVKTCGKKGVGGLFFGGLSWPKIVPGPLREAYFDQFLKYGSRHDFGAHPDGPRGPQNGPRGPRDGPRGPQDGSKRGPRRGSWTEISSPRPPEDPRRPQEAPKRPPRGPREAPRGPQEAPSMPQEAQRRPPISPK